jgi:hypothetical protein
MDTATLKLVVTRILEQCPSKLVSVCDSLADKAESAVRLNHSIDMRQAAAEEVRRSLSS